MAKKKDTHSSIKKNTPYKTVYMEYLDLFTFQKKPVTQEFIEMFFRRMLKEALENEDMLTVKEFITRNGVPFKDVYIWLKTDSRFEELYETVKSIIGSRREKGALKRKLDAHLVRISMPLFDDDWKKVEEWRAQLRNNNNNDTRNIAVYIDGVRSTDVVPPRKVDDE